MSDFWFGVVAGFLAWPASFMVIAFVVIIQRSRTATLARLKHQADYWKALADSRIKQEEKS